MKIMTLMVLTLLTAGVVVDAFRCPRYLVDLFAGFIVETHNLTVTGGTLLQMYFFSDNFDVQIFS